MLVSTSLGLLKCPGEDASHEKYIFHHKYEMPSLKILTYNVCFGCMTGSKLDKSALELAQRCKKTPSQIAGVTVCLLQVCANIDAIAELGKLHIVGLQEASNWQKIQTQSLALRDMKPIAGKLHAEKIVLFVSSEFEILWEGMGAVSNRPLQVAHLRHIPTETSIVVIHLHNNHGEKGTRQHIQKGISAIVGISEGLRDVRDSDPVICLGDWNDPKSTLAHLKPFERCSLLNIRNVSVSTEMPLPKSCCSTKTNDQRPFPGDYVTSNYATTNEIPQVVLHSLIKKDASDHFPVLGTVEVPSHEIQHPQYCVNVGFIASKYLTNDSIITKTQRLRLDEKGHVTEQGARVKAGDKVYILGVNDKNSMILAITPDSPSFDKEKTEFRVSPDQPRGVLMGFVRAEFVEGGRMTMKKTLRLQARLDDPNKQENVDSKPHKGKTLDEGARVSVLDSLNVDGTKFLLVVHLKK